MGKCERWIRSENASDSIHTVLPVISPALQVIKCWAKILMRVPGSRLVLKNKPFACETAKVRRIGRGNINLLTGFHSGCHS